MSLISDLAAQCLDSEYKQFMDAVFMQQENNPIWTAEKLSKLRREFPWKNTAILAYELGIDKDRVRWRARLMNLRKDRETAKVAREKFLDEIMAEYAVTTAPEIAEKHGVSVACVRGWISESRHGLRKRGAK